MKAVVCRAYGPPEVLVITQTDKPVPRKGEVLVKIMATAVNSADIRVRGLQVQGWLRLVMRLVLGFTKPRKPVLGTVLAGVVEATGDKVSRFKPGDEVFAITGFRFGTYASYACLPQHGTILHKPAGSTFEEAATILFGGMTALYFLEKAGLLKRQRPRVLVYGATGSVGAAAVEIARYHQARVTSVCSEEGLPLARALGSDDIVVYTRQDFTSIGEQFDIVFDAVGKTSRKACAGLLKAGGRFVTVDGLDTARETQAQMQQLKDMFEQGALHAHIDRTYKLEEIVEAHRYADLGRKKANIAVRVG